MYLLTDMYHYPKMYSVEPGVMNNCRAQRTVASFSNHDVSIERFGSHIALLAPHVMSNVCHILGKLQVHVISIAVTVCPN